MCFGLLFSLLHESRILVHILEGIRLVYASFRRRGENFFYSHLIDSILHNTLGEGCVAGETETTHTIFIIQRIINENCCDVGEVLQSF